jgi:hypothetical protein
VPVSEFYSVNPAMQRAAVETAFLPQIRRTVPGRHPADAMQSPMTKPGTRHARRIVQIAASKTDGASTTSTISTVPVDVVLSAPAHNEMIQSPPPNLIFADAVNLYQMGMWNDFLRYHLMRYGTVDIPHLIEQFRQNGVNNQTDFFREPFVLETLRGHSKTN